MNTSAERTFIEKEMDFLVNILYQNMDIFIIATHAKIRQNAKDYIEATKLNLLQNSKGNKKLNELEKYIYPVELTNNASYSVFGIKEIFNSLYEKYSKEKIYEQITFNNMNIFNTFFINNITKRNEKKRLEYLARRAKSNFKLLASSMGYSPNVKGTTMLSTAIIKIISKIYNINITTKECLELIETLNYTNELRIDDTASRKIEKTFAAIFYENGPAAKEVDYLAEYLINKYNKKLENDEFFLKYINNYIESINNSIESLKEITN